MGKIHLGYCYVKEKGFRLYNEAAELLYENDVEIKDLDKVNYWYYKAAGNDNKVALYKLGEFYEMGKDIGDFIKNPAFESSI